MTWGDADYGADSSAVQTQLKNVNQIQSLSLLLLPFFAMDPSSPGVMPSKVATAALCRLS